MTDSRLNRREYFIVGACLGVFMGVVAAASSPVGGVVEVMALVLVFSLGAGGVMAMVRPRSVDYVVDWITMYWR